MVLKITTIIEFLELVLSGPVSPIGKVWPKYVLMTYTGSKNWKDGAKHSFCQLAGSVCSILSYNLILYGYRHE